MSTVLLEGRVSGCRQDFQFEMRSLKAALRDRIIYVNSSPRYRSRAPWGRVTTDYRYIENDSIVINSQVVLQYSMCI